MRVESPHKTDRAGHFAPGPHDLCAVCGRQDDLVDRKVTDGWVTVCSEHDKRPYPKAVQVPVIVIDDAARKPRAAEHWTGTWSVLQVIAAGAPVTASEYYCAVFDAGAALADDRANEAHWRAAKAAKLGYRRGNVAPALAVVLHQPPQADSVPDKLAA